MNNDALGRRIAKTVGNTTTLFYYNPNQQVIAEYEGTTPLLTREYVYGNSINEILCMFFPQDDIGEDDFQQFLAFCEVWLSSYGQANYNDSLDVVNDNKIDFKDFAVFASQWGAFPSNTESHFYYLTDALGSVRGLVGGKLNREEDREFYNYNVYGASTDSSVAGNPFRFAGYRYDAESSLYFTKHRIYDPITGRWLQPDPGGYVDSMNLYEYAKSNPTKYIDPKGTNLYCIGGTAEKLSDNYNVGRFYNSYLGDDGPRVGQGKYYWDGPGTRKNSLWNMATGNDSKSIIAGVKNQICKDYCANPNVKINLVGWSRGAAIALAVSEKLQKEGCYCKIGSGLGCGLFFYPTVNWVGLFDAVDMSPSMEPRDADNANQVDHARKTQGGLRQPIFPTINLIGDNVRDQYFYGRDGSNTSHSDIGTGDISLGWMKGRGALRGIRHK